MNRMEKRKKRIERGRDTYEERIIYVIRQRKIMCALFTYFRSKLFSSVMSLKRLLIVLPFFSERQYSHVHQRCGRNILD